MQLEKDIYITFTIRESTVKRFFSIAKIICFVCGS